VVVEVDTMEVAVVEEDTEVVEGTMSDELPLPVITTDEVVIPVDTLLEGTTTEGMNLEGMIIDVMIDPPGETMTETGVLPEGMTGIGSMTVRTELLLPSPTEDLRKYLVLG
jgi:hypothetical protein